MPTTIVVRAPAKVNLYLGVGSVRPDGYHDVTTVLQAIDLADQIEISPAEILSVLCEPDLSIPQEQNLAYKAAVAFGELTHTPVTCRIVVSKRIPDGAGLGGGSSDAAAVLAGLAHIHGVPRTDLLLADAARSVGVDVAFFLVGGAAMLAGRGDELVRRLPALPGHVVLVKPSGTLSTADVYREFDRDPQLAAGPEGAVAALYAGDLGVLGNALANNLEPASFALVPESREALGWVRGRPGVTGGALAGSGSAVFGLCESAHVAETVAADAEARGWWSATAGFSASGAEVREEQGAE